MTAALIELLLMLAGVLLWLTGYFLRRRYFARAKVSPLRQLMPVVDLKRFGRVSLFQPLGWAVFGSMYMVDGLSGGPWWDYWVALAFAVVAVPISWLSGRDRTVLHRAVQRGEVSTKQLLEMVKGYIGKQEDKSYKLRFRRARGNSWGVEITCDNETVVTLRPRLDTSVDKLLLVLCVVYELYIEEALEISEGSLGTKIEMISPRYEEVV